MKTVVAVVSILFLFVCAAHAQETFTAFGSTVTYTRPDPAQWKVVHNGMHKKAPAYFLLFEHKPIKDAEGRSVKAVIGVICGKVPASLSLAQFAKSRQESTPFEVKKELTPKDGTFTYPNSIGYEAEYTAGSVHHKVLVAYLRHGEVGVQVICDSTEGVYDKVQADMKKFLHSLNFKK